MKTCSSFFSASQILEEEEEGLETHSALEHSVLHVWEIYALENAVFCIAVYGP